MIKWRYIKPEEEDKYRKMGIPVKIGPRGGRRIPVNEKNKPIMVDDNDVQKDVKMRLIDIYHSLESINESDDLSDIMESFNDFENNILVLFDSDRLTFKQVVNFIDKVEKNVKEKLFWLDSDEFDDIKVGMRTFSTLNLDDETKERINKYLDILSDDEKLNNFFNEYSGRYNDLIRDVLEDAGIKVEIEDDNFEIFDKLENLDERTKKQLLNALVTYDLVVNEYKRDLEFKISSEIVFQGNGYYMLTGYNSSKIEIQNNGMTGYTFIHCMEHELMHYINKVIADKVYEIKRYDDSFEADMILMLEKMMVSYFNKLYDKYTYSCSCYAMKNSEEFICELFPLTISGTGSKTFKKIVRENFKDFKSLNKLIKKYMKYGSLLVNE